MSQQGGAYFRQGDGALVVPSGTKIVVESGGQLEIAGVDQAAILAAIPISDQEDSETVWNDNGTLKVSGSGG